MAAIDKILDNVKTITLQDLKEGKINSSLLKTMKATWELDDYNKEVYHYRMKNGKIRWEIEKMTHDGNDPRRNQEILDRAIIYYSEQVYTDEEWEKYFLPAINKAMSDNDSFIRWLPGYVIKDKETGQLSIVKYDYAFVYGGTNYTDLLVVSLNDSGNPCRSWAWAHYNDYELIDANHVKENILKICNYD